MAIAYVGGRGAGRAGSTSTVNVAINSGLTGGIGSAAIAGDLVVVTVAVGTQGRNPSCAVSGYTAKTQQHTTATTYDISVCTSYKIMPTTPDTVVTIPSTGNVDDGQGYEIHVFRGVDPANVESVTATYATGSGTNNLPNGAAITPGHAGAWIYVGGGGAASSGTTVFTAAALSGFLSHNGSDTNDGTAGAGYYSGWTSGAYDPAAWTGGSANSANSWGATTLALRPAPGAYTLTCAVGSFTLAGQAVSLKRGCRLNIETGAFALAGQAVALRKGYPLSLGVGTFSLAGQAVALRRTAKLAVGVGAFTLTGQAVALKSGRKLPAGAGAFILTGQAVGLWRGARIAVGAGSFVLEGKSVSLLRGSRLAAGAGSFALQGQAVALKAGRRVTAGAGTFLLTGQDVTFTYTHGGQEYVLQLYPGVFELGGQDIALRKTWHLDIEAGAFLFEGKSCNLIRVTVPKSLLTGGSLLITNETGESFLVIVSETAGDSLLETSAAGDSALQLVSEISGLSPIVTEIAADSLVA